jgi:hypothetical protein
VKFAKFEVRSRGNFGNFRDTPTAKAVGRIEPKARPPAELSDALRAPARAWPRLRLSF